MDYLDPIETCVIILPELPQGVKFDIMNVMIYLLNLKRVFAGLLINGENIHVMNFIGICTLYNVPEVSQKEIKLSLFSFSLIREATLWLAELLRESITT